MENVLNSYLKYVENFMYSYYRLLLQENYSKGLVRPFINKYIDVRYYNNTIFEKEKKLLTRINKELSIIAKSSIEEYPDKEEDIKNIFALFSYILYLDDCIDYNNVNSLINMLLEDENIKLEYTIETQEKIKTLIKEFTRKKKELFKLFNDTEFELSFKRLKRNIEFVTINQNVKISKLYSGYAIERAWTSGTLDENKYLLLYYKLSAKILEDVINSKYNKKYIVDFPLTLFLKEKKSNRYLNALNNDIIKEHLCLRYYYKDYLANKEAVNELISLGYSITIDLDETFDNDFDCLILFANVLVHEKYDYYDYIVDDDFSNINYIVI